MKKELNDDDIKRVWENLVVITLDNIAGFLEGGGVKPVYMSNGYVASLSIDVLSERISMYHLSVNNPKGETGIVKAQKMAHEIFGEGYVQLDRRSISGCIQFIKEKIK